jgi:hypothetical protein
MQSGGYGSAAGAAGTIDSGADFDDGLEGETESEYEDEEYDEDEEGEYDDDTEEEGIDVQPRTYGPPPPPPPQQDLPNGKVKVPQPNGSVNGTRH